MGPYTEKAELSDSHDRSIWRGLKCVKVGSNGIHDALITLFGNDGIMAAHDLLVSEGA